MTKKINDEWIVLKLIYIVRKRVTIKMNREAPQIHWYKGTKIMINNTGERSLEEKYSKLFFRQNS